MRIGTSALRRRLTLVSLALLATLPVGFAAFAPVAAGKVIEVGGTKYGVRTRSTELLQGDQTEIETFGNPEGHPVVHSAPATYVVYWDPNDLYRAEWQSLINGFLANLGANVGEPAFNTQFLAAGQYSDSSGKPAAVASVFHGAYTDTKPYPLAAGCTDPDPLTIGQITCLTSSEVQTQLESFIAEHDLPKGMNTIYYVLPGPGVTVCLDAGATHCSDYSGGETGASYKNSFCSYHAAAGTGANTVLYAVVPFAVTGGLAYNWESPQKEEDACQDGGWNPTGEHGEEKEHAHHEAREAAEAKERAEIEATKEAASKRLKEIRETRKADEAEAKSEEETEEVREAASRESQEVEANRELKLAEIRQKSAKELTVIAEKEALEEPHVEEPHQDAAGSFYGELSTGLADLMITQVGLQQENVVTDPLLTAWQDSNGNEVTDECRNDFVPFAGGIGGSVTANAGTLAGSLSNQVLYQNAYYLNDIFNMAHYKAGPTGLPFSPSVPCVGHVDLVPKYTAPNAVNVGEVVGFDGMESVISLDWAGLTLTSKGRYATYHWNFGDGTPEVSGYAPGAPACTAPWLAPCAGSVFHTFNAGGAYKVTLTVEDVAGNTASVTHEITVVGSAAAAASSGSTTTTNTTTTTSVTTATTSTTASAASIVYPPPKIKAVPMSSSLTTAVKTGVALRYAVNEQVAGVAEVLLNAKTAARLKVKGPVAVDLPAGFPRSILIGRAVVDTQRGGKGSVRLSFSKANDKALEVSQVAKLNLTLRLVVHNASRTGPATTSLLTSFVLKGPVPLAAPLPYF